MRSSIYPKMVLTGAVVLALATSLAPAAGAAGSGKHLSLSTIAETITVQPGNQAMYLNWPDYPGASGYTILVQNPDGSQYSSQSATISQASVLKLTNGVPYLFTVAALTSAGSEQYPSIAAAPRPVSPQPTTAPVLAASTRTTLAVTVAALTPAAGVEPLTGYQVRLSPKDGTGEIVYAVADLVTKKATATGLTTGEAYTIDYAGLNTVDGHAAIGPYSAKVLTATPTGAAAPSGVRVTYEGNKSVTLAWDEVAAASKYTVYYKNPSGVEKSLSTAATTPVPTTVKVTGLDNAQQYALQVAATTVINGTAKIGDRSDAVYATPMSPSAPSDLRVSGIGNAKIYLDWNPVSGAESYYLKAEVVDDNGLTPAVPTPVKIATTATAATKAISGLTNGVDYRIRIATTLDGVAGNYTSDAASVKATPAAVPGVTNPTKGTVTGTSIQVTWKAPTAITGVDPADRYKVTFTSANGSEAIVKEVGSALSATATGLSTGVTYTVSVQAGNADGYGMTSTTPLLVVASDKPGAVLSPSVARDSSGTGATVAWSKPNYTGGTVIKNYTITAKQTNPAGTAPAAQTVSSTTATFTGLVASSDYTFSIVANTDAGAGPAVTTGTLAEAPAASGAVSYDYAANTVTMSWNTVANPRLSYQAEATQRARIGSESSTTIVLPASMTCTADTCTATFDKFNDNINGEPWLFRVRATDDLYSTSNWSAARTPTISADASDINVVTSAHSTCPAGSELIEGNLCRETTPYTYHTEIYGPVESYETAGGCPSGWNMEDYGWVKYCRRYEGRTVKNPTPAGWSDNGSQWYRDFNSDSYSSYSLASGFPWTPSARENAGVVNMIVDGSAVPGKTSDLGRCPGAVSAGFTGLAGSVNTSYNLCN